MAQMVIQKNRGKGFFTDRAPYNQNEIVEELATATIRERFDYFVVLNTAAPLAPLPYIRRSIICTIISCPKKSATVQTLVR